MIRQANATSPISSSSQRTLRPPTPVAANMKSVRTTGMNLNSNRMILPSSRFGFLGRPPSSTTTTRHVRKLTAAKNVDIPSTTTPAKAEASTQTQTPTTTLPTTLTIPTTPNMPKMPTMLTMPTTPATAYFTAQTQTLPDNTVPGENPALDFSALNTERRLQQLEFNYSFLTLQLQQEVRNLRNRLNKQHQQQQSTPTPTLTPMPMLPAALGQTITHVLVTIPTQFKKATSLRMHLPWPLLPGQMFHGHVPTTSTTTLTTSPASPPPMLLQLQLQTNTGTQPTTKMPTSPGQTIQSVTVKTPVQHGKQLLTMQMHIPWPLLPGQTFQGHVLSSKTTPMALIPASSPSTPTKPQPTQKTQTMITSPTTPMSQTPTQMAPQPSQPSQMPAKPTSQTTPKIQTISKSQTPTPTPTKTTPQSPTKMPQTQRPKIQQRTHILRVGDMVFPKQPPPAVPRKLLQERPQLRVASPRLQTPLPPTLTLTQTQTQSTPLNLYSAEYLLDTRVIADPCQRPPGLPSSAEIFLQRMASLGIKAEPQQKKRSRKTTLKLTQTVSTQTSKPLPSPSLPLSKPTQSLQMPQSPSLLQSPTSKPTELPQSLQTPPSPSPLPSPPSKLPKPLSSQLLESTRPSLPSLPPLPPQLPQLQPSKLSPQQPPTTVMSIQSLLELRTQSIAPSETFLAHVKKLRIHHRPTPKSAPPTPTTSTQTPTQQQIKKQKQKNQKKTQKQKQRETPTSTTLTQKPTP